MVVKFSILFENSRNSYFLSRDEVMKSLLKIEHLTFLTRPQQKLLDDMRLVINTIDASKCVYMHPDVEEIIQIS